MALEEEYARALADIMGSNASYLVKQKAISLLKQRFDTVSKAAPVAKVIPEGMAPTGATIEGVNYRPLPDVELMERERALKQADLISSRYNIPILDKPAYTNDKGVAIPAVIGSRRGTVADFMSGSNPYETYTSPGAIPEVDPLTGTTEIVNERNPRPAMYFGRDIPAIPVDPADYMQVMELSSRAAGNRVPMTTPTGQATPVPPVVPTATPRYVQGGTPVPIATPTPMIAQADPFAGIPVVGDPSIIGNTAFQTQPLKKLDATLARNFLSQAGNNPQKARQLASQSGFYW